MNKSGYCLIFLFLLISSIAIGQGNFRNPIEKLDSTINTDEYDEISPIVCRSVNKLFFTRIGTRDNSSAMYHGGKNLYENFSPDQINNALAQVFSNISKKSVSDPWTSVFNQDIYYSEFQNSLEGQVSHPGYPVNSALPNSVCSCVEKNGDIIVINQFYRDGSMYPGFSRIHNNENVFSFPEPLHIYEFITAGSEVGLTLSQDEEIMIISMLDERDTSANLYISFKAKPGVYSPPKPISDLNTNFRESTPFITADKTRLFFASDREGGLGGLDIYVSERLDYTYQKWSEPKLLNEPVNSSSDDSEPFLDSKLGYIYFTSKRDGSSDIFRLNLEKPSELSQEMEIKGLVVDASIGKPTSAEVYFGPKKAKNYLEFFRTSDGRFRTSILVDDVLKFYPKKARYRSDVTLFDPRVAAKINPDAAQLTLYVYPESMAPGDPIVVMERKPISKKPPSESSTPYVDHNNKVVIDPIMFYRTKATVRKISYPVLNQLTLMMKENKSIKVRIDGHTDNVGDKDALIKLSLKRADAIRNYLVSSGVHTSRVKIEGHGDTRPLNDNGNEKMRAKNRRVEIFVLE